VSSVQITILTRERNINQEIECLVSSNIADLLLWDLHESQHKLVDMRNLQQYCMYQLIYLECGNGMSKLTRKWPVHSVGSYVLLWNVL